MVSLRNNLHLAKSKYDLIAETTMGTMTTILYLPFTLHEAFQQTVARCRTSGELYT